MSSPSISRVPVALNSISSSAFTQAFFFTKVSFTRMSIAGALFPTIFCISSCSFQCCFDFFSCWWFMLLITGINLYSSPPWNVCIEPSRSISMVIVWFPFEKLNRCSCWIFNHPDGTVILTVAPVELKTPTHFETLIQSFE